MPRLRGGPAADLSQKRRNQATEDSCSREPAARGPSCSRTPPTPSEPIGTLHPRRLPEPTILDLDVIREADFRTEPYPHFLGHDFLREASIPALRADFPDITKPGYLTVDDVEVRGAFRQLIDEIEGEALTEALSQRFGLDLHPFPRLTTVRKLSQAKDGRIHTDGPSKVMTMLVYMNDDWTASADGRLRVVYNATDFEPFACEVPPTMGTVFGFLRGDQSWHGHKPFAGERRVVQVAWVRDAEELERKKRRNTMAKFLKGIFGR